MIPTLWKGLDLPTDLPISILDGSSQIIDRTETEVANASDITKSISAEIKEKAPDTGR